MYSRSMKGLSKVVGLLDKWVKLQYSLVDGDNIDALGLDGITEDNTPNTT